MRDKEDEKIVKGLMKVINWNKDRFNAIEEENNYIKSEIEKLGDKIDRRREDNLERKIESY